MSPKKHKTKLNPRLGLKRKKAEKLAWRRKESEKIPKPDVIDLEHLPCCGISSLYAKRRYDEKKKTYKHDDWFCTSCKMDIPAWFVLAIREDRTGFVERIQAGIVKAATVKAVEDKSQPNDPKFQRQINKIDAFRAGVLTCADPYALCPYAQDSELYIPWQMGRDRGPEVKYLIESKGMVRFE